MNPDPDPDPDRRARVVIDLAIAHARWRRAVPRVESIAREAALAVLEKSGPKRGTAELSLVLTNDETVAGLNKRWRHRAGPTNVLAFASEERLAPPAPLILGDVVLAYETVAKEAKEQGKALADHLRHLIIHGVLHLLGYDHDAAGPARRMEALETHILARLGVADPYRAREDVHG